MAATVWVPWCVSAAAIVVYWLIGEKRKSAFALNAALNAAMAAYSVETAQYGFIPYNIIVGFLSVRNFRKWKADERGTVDAGSEGRDLAEGKRRGRL